MITQEFLSQCRDEQINRGVAWCNVTNKNISMLHAPSSIDKLWCNYVLSMIRPFCSMPDAIMPIAFANKIDIRHGHDVSGNTAGSRGFYNTYYKYKATNPNLLRAICEVYILMSVNK